MTSIDLSKFKLTFSDDFNAISVSSDPKSNATWYNRTPWNGDFGSASFKGSDTNGTFAVQDGILDIRAQKGADGKWTSGLLASVDPNGQGFSQQYGYFEMRAQLPNAPGTWPAFWLIGMNRVQPGSTYTAEIDVMEQHGDTPTYFSSTTHVVQRPSGIDNRHFTKAGVPATMLSEGFHTYGVLVQEDKTTFFLDGQAHWSIATPAEYKQPLMVLANLGLGGGWSTDKTPNGTAMKVDYIHVYSELPAAAHQSAIPAPAVSAPTPAATTEWRFADVFDLAAREAHLGGSVLSAKATGSQVVGTVGNDLVNGGAGADRLQGHKGDDVLHGNAGNDYLIGDAGSDALQGDAGDDQLYGAVGNDYLLGGAGNDLLNGGGGIDRLFGGEGADRYVIRAKDKIGGPVASPDLPAQSFAQWVQIEGLDFAAGDRLELEGMNGLTGAIGKDSIVSTQKEFDALVALLKTDADARTNAVEDRGHDSLVLTLLDAAGASHVVEVLHAAAVG